MLYYVKGKMPFLKDRRDKGLHSTRVLQCGYLRNGRLLLLRTDSVIQEVLWRGHKHVRHLGNPILAE